MKCRISFTCNRRFLCGWINSILTLVIGALVYGCNCEPKIVERQADPIEIWEIFDMSTRQFSVSYSRDSLWLEYSFENEQFKTLSVSPTIMCLIDGDSTEQNYGFENDAFVTELRVVSADYKAISHSGGEWNSYPFPKRMTCQFVAVPIGDTITLQYAVPMSDTIYDILKRRHRAYLSVAVWKASDLQKKFNFSPKPIRRVELNDTCCGHEWMTNTDILAGSSQDITSTTISASNLHAYRELVKYRVRGGAPLKNASRSQFHNRGKRR